MNRLGLIGGMSWVSTRLYYEHINRIVQREVDPQASAPMVIDSLDFRPIYRLSDKAGWARATTILVESARRLEQAGAGMVLIGANSMHKVHAEVQAAVSIPILHIAECVGARMAADGVRRAALMGTRNVMLESFYRRRLVGHGIDLLPPAMAHVEELDRIIYDELMIGRATRDAQRSLKTMLTNLAREGAEAVVLANTELGLVVDVDANVLPIYDCTRIHAEDAARWVISG